MKYIVNYINKDGVFIEKGSTFDGSENEKDELSKRGIIKVENKETEKVEKKEEDIKELKEKAGQLGINISNISKKETLIKKIQEAEAKK